MKDHPTALAVLAGRGVDSAQRVRAFPARQRTKAKPEARRPAQPEDHIDRVDMIIST